MAKWLRWLDRIIFAMIGILLGAMVLDVTIQVVFRYIIQDPPTWTEEAARFLCIWMVFLGAGLAFGRGTHIVVDALYLVLPPLASRLLHILINSLALAFLLVVFWQGIEMVGMTSNTTSTAMQLNMGIVYAGLPIGAAIAIIYVVARLMNLLRGTMAGGNPSGASLVD